MSKVNSGGAAYSTILVNIKHLNCKKKNDSLFRLAESNISQSQSIKKRKGKRNISKESRLTETRTVNPFVSLLAQNMQIRATLCRTLNFKVCLVKTLALDCQTLHLKSGPEEINKFLSAFPPPTSTHNEYVCSLSVYKRESDTSDQGKNVNDIC